MPVYRGMRFPGREPMADDPKTNTPEAYRSTRDKGTGSSAPAPDPRVPSTYPGMEEELRRRTAPPQPRDLPTDESRKERTLREKLERAAEESEARSAAPTDPLKTGISEKWTRQFFEFAGLGFILGPPGFLGEALLKSEAINWALMIAIFVGFWTIGGISLAAGLTWPAWRPSNAARAAIIEKAAYNVWVWVSIVLAVAFGPALLVAGFSRPAVITYAPDTPVIVAPMPAAPAPFFNEATPHAPPKLGPLATLRMVDSIAAKGNVLSPSGFIDQKWALVVTFPRENDEVAQIVRRIVGSKLTTIPIPPPNPNDLDAPQLIGATEAGITLHGNNQLNERLFHELGSCFNVKKTGRAPDNLQSWYVGHVPDGFQVDWIDVGPGSPWKEPFPPQCAQ